jgi:acetylornithine deacetylase/succinyl-diaminopimelate desuccinylase-like protein
MPGETDWLRERLEELERIERPSASDGERRAAEWLVAQLGELGAEARIEAESAAGTYWWSLGLGGALGVFAAALALRGRRLLAALCGLLGAAGIFEDFPPRQRRMRRLLPRRTTYNVTCELGDPAAARTVVFIAHHDAPHSGLVFHPKPAHVADASA